MKTKEMMYRVGRWLLANSGNGGEDAWTRLQQENDELHASYSRHEVRRVENLKRLEAALRRYQTWEQDLALVDGLMAQGQFKEAQALIRVAFIKARRPEGRHQYSQNELAAMMAGQMQQAPSPMLGGLGNAFDQMFRNRQWP